MSKSTTKVEKTTPKAIEKKAVKKAPDKAKVVNSAKGAPRAKKPIAKPTAKSPAVKKAAEAAIPAKVNPSSSSEATNEIKSIEDTVSSIEEVKTTETKVTEEDVKQWLMDNNFRLTVLNKQPIDVYVVAGSHFTIKEEFISGIYGVSRNENDAKAILETKVIELSKKLSTRIKLKVHHAIINPYASDMEIYNSTIEVSRLGPEWFSISVWIENLFKKIFNKNK